MATFWRLCGRCALVLSLVIACNLPTKQTEQRNAFYITNKAPLTVQPYTLLPLGAVKPEGWLKEQLVLMKHGMTGNLDELYEKVVELGGENWGTQAIYKALEDMST